MALLYGENITGKYDGKCCARIEKYGLLSLNYKKIPRHHGRCAGKGGNDTGGELVYKLSVGLRRRIMAPITQKPASSMA